MQKPLVSIVLPMYRVANVLPACIASLKRQTYRRLELLFVDDCSPDESASIVENERASLEALGMIVKLICHSENGGVAVARNTALDNASGEWIFHYDADDRLSENAIELMIKEALRSDADIVGFQWMLCHGDKERQMTQVQVETGQEAFEAMCSGIFKWNLWLFLVRRSLLEQNILRFLPKQNMGEDMMLMAKLFLRARKLSVLPETLYYYTKNDEGQLTGSYTDAHWAQVDTNLRELERYALGQGQKPEMIAQLKLSLKLPLLISPRKEDHERWATWFPEANAYIMQNKALPLRTRLLQLAASCGQWWLVRLYYEVVMKRLYALLYK